MALVPKHLRPAPTIRVDDNNWVIGESLHERRAREQKAQTPPAESAPAEPPARDIAPLPAPVRREAIAAPPPSPPRPAITRSAPSAPLATDSEKISNDDALAIAAAWRNRMPGGAARPGAAEQARREKSEARLICESLRLYHLCSRTGCRRARHCRGLARLCLDTRGAAAPAEARDWVEALIDAARNGEYFEDVQEARPLEQLAYAGWIAGLEARARVR